MRWIAVAIIPLSHCAPSPAPPPTSAPPPSLPAASSTAVGASATPVLASPLPTSPPRIARSQVAGIRFEGVGFDARLHQLVVVDQAGGPGSRFADAAQAASSRRGQAAINGGFFDPGGRPLGLIISGGQPRGNWNRASSLCSGTWLVDSGGQMAIFDRTVTSPSLRAEANELLQSGPMLIRNGATVRGLEAKRRASRSLLAWDGGHRWWLGTTSECSLLQLGQALRQPRVTGWQVTQALNLDGGSSTDLWVSGRIRGGPHQAGPWWRKPARNYLVLVPRSIEP